MDTPADLDLLIHSSSELIIIRTISSMIAAAIVISAFYPLECIEARMQLGLIEKSSVMAALRKSGLRNCYTGCIASVLGHVFAWGIFIFISDICKNHFFTDYVDHGGHLLSCKKLFRRNWSFFLYNSLHTF